MRRDMLHLRAPGNWMNDPNGFIYYKGRYHLFYQYFPYAPVWGTMHWGHAVSEDLIHWEHLGIALFPTKAYDQNGVFSGSAIEKDGELYLYYSAVRYLETDEEDIHVAPGDRYETSQAMIVSKDGYHFDNWKDKKKIIPVIMDEEIANRAHTRDPKVWKDGDYYYMILGSTYEEQGGRVLFYRSRDAREWDYVSQCRSEQFGKVLECPDLFRAGGEYIFVGSPMYVSEDGLEYAHQAMCALADYDASACELKLGQEMRLIDYGMDLYAPQTNVDKDGRRVMIAWMRMPKAVGEKQSAPGQDTDCQPGVRSPEEIPWRGMMCLPRVVEVRDGHIFFRVHQEAERYFSDRLDDLPDGICTSGSDIAVEAYCGDSRCMPYRLRSVLEEGQELDIGGYRIWIEDDRVKADRSKVFGGIEGYRLAGSTPKLGGRYELDIFVDHNLIETFVNGGQYVLSQVVYGLQMRDGTGD